MVLGTSISRPSTFTLILSIDAGADLGSVVVALNISCLMRTRRHCQFRPRPRAQFRPTFLIRGATRDKLVLELPHKTLDGPRAGFSERADRPAAGDVVRDPDQVIRVALAPFAVSQTVQGLGHP